MKSLITHPQMLHLQVRIINFTFHRFISLASPSTRGLENDIKLMIDSAKKAQSRCDKYRKVMRGRSLFVSHLKALIKSKVRERVFLVATTFEIAVRMNEADLFVIGEGIFAQRCRFHKFIDESITFW